MNKVTFCAIFLLLGIVGHMSVNAYPGLKNLFKKDEDDPKITVIIPGDDPAVHVDGHEGKKGKGHVGLLGVVVGQVGELVHEVKHLVDVVV